jgi:hypothetical protein
VQVCDARKLNHFPKTGSKTSYVKTIIEKITAQLIFAAQQQTLFNG